MDSLVAKYSTPSYEQEAPQEDQMELYQPAPGLSLKFAMPPVAHVSLNFTPSELLAEAGRAIRSSFRVLINSSLAICLAPSGYRRPCEPKLPH